MNVIWAENTLVSARGRETTRGRGRGRGRGRDGTIIPNNNQIVKVLPKYDFTGFRQPLVNIAPSSTSTFVTPKNSRIRNTTTSSSSFRKSASRRRGRGSAGQISPYSVSSEVEHCVVLAITSGRGDARGEVGMAAIDVQYPHMILCQISDCNTYINTLTKIHAFNPVEIIMPDTMCERSIFGNSLHRAIKERFSSIPVTSIGRIHFHDNSGMDRIQTHCAEEYSSVELVVEQKYYALAAAAALFKYIEYIQHITYAPKSMHIEFQGSQNTTMIDIESVESLELVTSQGGIRTFSLLSALDRCSTPMGRRLIRASILQPPCELELIKSRQACVTELVTNRPFAHVVQPVVKRLYGASRLLSLGMLTSQTDNVQSAEKNLNYILLLKNVIDIIPELRSIISNGQASFFQKVATDLQDHRYELIKEKILSVVHPEARSVMGYTSSNMQRCFAIRSGLNDMLDIARQTYCELIDDMQKLVEILSQRYQLRLSLGCNANLGYHIELEVPRSQNIKINEIPEELIEVHQQKNTFYMTTEYLMVLNKHCQDACEELHIMSNVLLNEVMRDVRDHIGCLFKLSDDIGELDLLISFAQISSLNGYVLPTFGKRLELRESRHPVMDIWNSESPIPNDVVATTSYNFHTIIGPNMSGKSVYLKQIVLLQIMAQMGCCVPAREAHFRIADRIFCRMCPRADIESNNSGFSRQIKESQYILQSITSTSLVVIDELCCGTTFEEGTSLAWSICEKLVRSSAFTFNATHFFYLTRLTELYHNVKNHYLETLVDSSQARNSRMIYTHKLKPGIFATWNYGITLARSTGSPQSIISDANVYADEIANSIKPSETENSTESWKKTFYDCLAEMKDFLEKDEFTVHNIVELVNRYKVPSVLWQMKTSRKMEVAEARGTTSSVQFCRNQVSQEKIVEAPNVLWQMTKSREIQITEREESTKLEQFCRNNDNQEKIIEKKLSKRESITSLHAHIDSKKSKVLPKEEFSIASVSRFILKEDTRMKSPIRSVSGSDEQSLFNKINMNLSELRKIPMDFEDEQFDNHSRSQVSNENKYFDDTQSISISSPDFKSLVGTSQGRNEKFLADSNFSQASSISTYIAKISARNKEANIFKDIEGSDFDEEAFFRSIESSDDDLMIVDEKPI